VSLSDWANSGWLQPHSTSPDEIRRLMDIADRDLQDCQAQGLSADWKLNISYNAALQCATAALYASGYGATRESRHYRIIQSLAFTIGADRKTIDLFDTFRSIRNTSEYDRAGTVSKQNADEMYNFACNLYIEVESWLQANHPHLIR